MNSIHGERTINISDYEGAASTHFAMKQTLRNTQANSLYSSSSPRHESNDNREEFTRVNPRLHATPKFVSGSRNNSLRAVNSVLI